MGRGRVRCALLYSCIGPAHFLGMRRVGGAIDVVETGILNAKHGKISFQIRVMPPYARLGIVLPLGWDSGCPPRYHSKHAAAAFCLTSAGRAELSLIGCKGFQSSRA